MTDINEYLAREVMGYLRHLASDGREYWTLYQNRSDCIRIPIADFRPTERIEQAIECAKALPGFGEIRLEPVVYWDSKRTNPKLWKAIVFRPVDSGTATGETEAAALSEAVARAAGWEG